MGGSEDQFDASIADSEGGRTANRRYHEEVDLSVQLRLWYRVTLASRLTRPRREGGVVKNPTVAGSVLSVAHRRVRIQRAATLPARWLEAVVDRGKYLQRG
jgi:hypothetical protein